MRVHRSLEHPTALVEAELPERRSPFSQLVAAPDVVDEDVQAPVLSRDAGEKRLDVSLLGVVDAKSSGGSAASLNELLCLFDRLWPSRQIERRRRVARRLLRCPAAPPRAVHEGAGDAELERDRSAGPSSCARHEGHLAIERRSHRPLPRNDRERRGVGVVGLKSGARTRASAAAALANRTKNRPPMTSLLSRNGPSNIARRSPRVATRRPEVGGCTSWPSSKRSS